MNASTAPVTTSHEAGGVARPGRNCFHRSRAPRVALLTDADAYFAAVASACRKATETIIIAGWAIDSRVRLTPGRTDDDELPDELGPFLAALVRRSRTLRVRVLAWDVGMVFGIESGFAPVFRTAEERRWRFQWELDSEHAFGAGQHQKIVLIDDSIAFVGGIDLTGERWDSPEHLPHDERRMHAGKPYDPIHDVAVMFDGPPAAALGVLMRERWQRATGKDVPLSRIRRSIPGLEPGSAMGGMIDRAGGVFDRVGDFSRRTTDRALESWRALRGTGPPGTARDCWPDGVEPDAFDAPVALARTEAKYLWHPGVREIETLWLDSIAAAREVIFIENQYFTSRSIAEALASRLAEPDGPEVIIVQPLYCAGWLEQATMGVLRDEHLQSLREADVGGRLRVYYPVAADGTPIYVHSKVLFIDDSIARIGSANVANRALALDTEVDAHLESEGREDLTAIYASWRDRLVAEHLGVEPSTLRDAREREGSLGKAVDALRGEGRSLRELSYDSPRWLRSLVPQGLADPERPADPRQLSDSLIPVHPARMTRWEKARAILVVSILATMALGWVFVPLSGGEAAEALAARVRPVVEAPFAPFLAVGVFLVAGVLMFPMSVLVLATELAFGAGMGSVISLVGGMASSIAGYAQGRVIGRRWLRRLGGTRVNAVSRALARHGVLTIAAARLMPLVPWTLTSLIAGASHVRPLDYVLGTLGGLVPVVLAAALLSDAASRPGMYGLLAFGLFLLLMAGMFAWGRALLRRTSGG